LVVGGLCDDGDSIVVGQVGFQPAHRFCGELGSFFYIESGFAMARSFSNAAGHHCRIRRGSSNWQQRRDKRQGYRYRNEATR
jgi:hypothetical protein